MQIQVHSEDVLVPVNREILDRLKEYLASIGDTETTYSSVIANWIDKQKIADRYAGVEIKKLKLGTVDYYMEYLGGTLNLLDPDGTFKGMPDEETLKKLMVEVRRNYRDLSDAILALREKSEK